MELENSSMLSILENQVKEANLVLENSLEIIIQDGLILRRISLFYLTMFSKKKSFLI